MKRINHKLIFLITFLILISLFYFTYSYSFNNKNNYVSNQNVIDTINDNYVTEVSLIMVGDALIHNGVYNDAYENGTYDFNYLFNELNATFKNYDLKYYNQETILGGVELGLSSYPLFNSPFEVGDAFVNAGFNLVSLATNHSLDKGESGLLNSLNYWKNQDSVLSAGSYESEKERITPQIKEMNGITYTLFSYSTLTNGLSIPDGKDYLFDLYEENKVKEDIERVRDKVDVIMVAMHWGSEYTHTPTEEEIKIANYLAELGVDIIIGTHPHVIQPIDFIGNTMVVYSLGNFVSSQVGIDRLVGLMASVTIRKEVNLGGTKITLEKPTAELVYTKKATGNKPKQFMLYPFSKLTNEILPDYQKYYEYYMNIVTKNNKDIIKK